MVALLVAPWVGESVVELVVLSVLLWAELKAENWVGRLVWKLVV
jgi:hypothetical protein